MTTTIETGTNNVCVYRRLALVAGQPVIKGESKEDGGTDGWATCGVGVTSE